VSSNGRSGRSRCARRQQWSTKDDAAGVLLEVNACRQAHPGHYVKVNAYDARLGRQTTALSFLVQRPAHHPLHDPLRRHRAPLRGALLGRMTARPSFGTPSAPDPPPDEPRPPDAVVDLTAVRRAAGVDDVLADLDRGLVGLAPVKARIAEIAVLLLVDRTRARFGTSWSRSWPPGRSGASATTSSVGRPAPRSCTNPGCCGSAARCSTSDSSW
jgi:hypothetical protein